MDSFSQKKEFDLESVVRHMRHFFSQYKTLEPGTNASIIYQAQITDVKYNPSAREIAGGVAIGKLRGRESYTWEWSFNANEPLLVVRAGKITDYKTRLLDQLRDVGNNGSSALLYVGDANNQLVPPTMAEIRIFAHELEVKGDAEAIRLALEPLDAKIMAAYRVVREMQKEFF